jgi:membrane protein DedA with SNARE-associated domain
MEHLLATWGYLALFAATFISAMALPIGAEIAIGYAGALASGQLTGNHDHLKIGLVILVAVVGEVTGSTLGYSIGRYGGRALVDKVGRFILLTHEDLDRAEAWFARRGEPVVFFGRFVPLLRSFISLAAGLGEMKLAKFLLFTVPACLLWCAALAGIGDALGSTWHHVIKVFSDVGYVVAAVIVITIVGLFLHRYRKVRAERASAPA